MSIATACSQQVESQYYSIGDEVELTPTETRIGMQLLYINVYLLLSLILWPDWLVGWVD